MNGGGPPKRPQESTHSYSRAPLSPRRPSGIPGKFPSLMVDGVKDEIENMTTNISMIAKSLASDDESELTLVLFEMQQVFLFCREYAEDTLIPIICSKVMNWSDSLQLAAGEALVAVSVDKLRGEIAKTVSKTASDIVILTKAGSVREIWGHVLTLTLPHVTWTAKELNKFVNELDRWASHRKLHARILGSLAVSSKDEALKIRIMRNAVQICKDRDVDVRGMVAESLSSIGASVSVTIVEKEVWPCLLTLWRDEDARIHAATMRALSHIALSQKGKNPKAKLFNKYIPSVLLQECANIRRSATEDQRIVDDDKYLSLEINSEVYGELICSCYDRLRDESARKEVFKAFIAMATCNGPIVRKNCAFNMPGVASCFADRGAFQLSAIVEFLSRDSDPETRWRLAAGLHETIKVLAAKDTIENLFDTVLRLLADPNPVVKLNTLRHLEKVISELAKHSGYNSVQKLEPIFESLHGLAKGNWRTQELLAKQLKLAAPLVPPPIIRANILPLLYRVATDSSNLVRKSTMAAIATCMRYLPDTVEREQVMCDFRDEWARGTIYWMRISFIDSALTALEIYSKCLFRDTYGSEVLRLSLDRVSNVRLRVAKLLPLIAPSCFQMEDFHNAVKRLRQDCDVDIRDAMCTVDEKIDAAMNQSTENFEDDMKREAEEQELFAIHLKAQRDDQRKNGSRNRAKTMFFGKSARSPTTATPRTLLSNENDHLKASSSSEPPSQMDSSKIEHNLDLQIKRHSVGESRPSLIILRKQKTSLAGRSPRDVPKREHSLWKPRKNWMSTPTKPLEALPFNATQPSTLSANSTGMSQSPGSTPKKRLALKGVKSSNSFLKKSPRQKNE